MLFAAVYGRFHRSGLMLFAAVYGRFHWNLMNFCDVVYVRRCEPLNLYDDCQSFHADR